MIRINWDALVLTIMCGMACSAKPIELQVGVGKSEHNNEITCGDFVLKKDLELGIVNKISAPVAAGVDILGNIYVLDKGDDVIRVYSTDGTLKRTISNLTEGKATLPIIDFALDDKWNVYSIDLDRSTGKASCRINSIPSHSSTRFEVGLLPGQLAVTDRYVFISDDSYQNDYLVYAFSKDGEARFGIEKVRSRSDPQEVVIQNKVNLGVDNKGNLYLAYRYIPKVIKCSKEGVLLSEFEYLPQIKNRKKPFETSLMQRDHNFEKRSAEYPVCYDIAVDGNEMIYLLVAADHARPGKTALYVFDPSGTFKIQVDLPLYCSAFIIDSKGNFYFLGNSTAKSVVKYKRFPSARISGSPAHEAEKEESPAMKERLAAILKKCAAYSRRLDNASLDFVCEEEVIEITDTYKDIQLKYGTENPKLLASLPRLIKNKFLYDYQVIRKNNKIQETRIMLEDNGKRVNIKDAQLKTQAFKYQDIVFGPRVFNEYWQQYHNYRIIGEEILNGKRAVVIEVTPSFPKVEVTSNESSRKWLMSGRVWISEDDHSVIKIEMDKKSITDDSTIDERARIYKSEPMVAMTCEYETERKGIRYPSRFSIEEAYVNQSGQRFVRTKINVIYKNYKYFSVETEETIKKQAH